jgi:hypothetical protein
MWGILIVFFISVLSLEVPLLVGRDMISLTGLPLPYFVLLQSQDLGFQRHMSSSVCIQWLEVTGCIQWLEVTGCIQ